jgi:hypothetical protein
MMPLLWVLAADSNRTDQMLWSAVTSLLFAGALIVALLWFHLSTTHAANVVASMHGYLIGIAALITTGAISAIGTLRLRAHSTKRALVMMGAGWMLAATLLELGPAAINNMYSAKELAHALTQRGANTPVFSVDMYDQTLAFYLGHPVTLVRYRGELEFGISLDSANYIATLDEFVQSWDLTPRAFAVMKPRTYDELKRLGVAMNIIARDANYIAVAKPSAPPLRSAS